MPAGLIKHTAHVSHMTPSILDDIFLNFSSKQLQPNGFAEQYYNRTLFI